MMISFCLLFFSLLWKWRNGVGLIFINLLFFIILIFLSWLDDNISMKFINFENTEDTSIIQECSNLTTTDPLVISAHSRIQTSYCKSMLKWKLCSISSTEPWPIFAIDNTCGKFFDYKQYKIELGCFLDTDTDKLLTNYQYKFPTKNSPDLCIQTCLRAGFAYAGVKLGIECHCGSSFDLNVNTSRLIDADLCKHFVCPGSSLMFCGGYQAINIYKTGAQGKHNVNMPKFYSIEDKAVNTTNLSVKILFLLQLNGRNSRQIRQLLSLIYNTKHLYYVHVDKRQNYMYSEMIKIQRTLKNTKRHNFYVTKNRFATIWGGTSLLELFLRVIAETKHGYLTVDVWNSWDYIINLSESDMPLLSLEELEHNLASAVGMSFLSSHGYNTANFIQKQGFNFYFMECEKRMWRVATRNNFPLKLRLDGGSDWLAIHKDLAEFAVSDLELPSQFRLLFTTILLPLESFFHTLALNSDQFCERVIYRNLRFTNWRRKQGCRCEVLKPVVDWCGCSPLALREKDIRKIQLSLCQSKALFFGRKFDSLVDIKPINEVARQVLRYRQPQIFSSVMNSTWINIYSLESDNLTQFAARIPLLEAIISSLLTKNALLNAINCQFQRLISVYVYKENGISDMQSVFTFEVECPEQNCRTCEILFELIPPSGFNNDSSDNETIIDNNDGDGSSFIFDRHSGIQFGTDFDVKEEIFRVFPPIIDNSLNTSFTLKWHWMMAFSTVNNNYTSPNVTLELHDSNNVIILRQSIVQYDSVDGNQFIYISMQQLQNIHTGIWTASLFTSESMENRKKIAHAKFPVFPVIKNLKNVDTEIGNLIKEMTLSYFAIEGICAIHSTSASESLFFEDCTKTRWSSFYPDGMSKFPTVE